MSAFRLPTMNLTCNVFRNYTGALPIPPTTQPYLASVPCQLRTLRGPFAIIGTLSTLPRTLLLVPRGTDIRAQQTGGGSIDIIECPSGTGRYYKTMGVEDVAKGFPNEYRVVTIQQEVSVPGGWPYPTP